VEVVASLSVFKFFRMVAEWLRRAHTPQRMVERRQSAPVRSSLPLHDYGLVIPTCRLLQDLSPFLAPTQILRCFLETR
jgi:hypothetical protein